ncbi:hypothetical protein RBSH_01314 [Rhodopirellula baltica SH28]|uniref:Uncharacterized protein n=1 Tax=Rhodopirellula baltica SH28 TaxID=993517 RepID=K5CHA5_RHOBT|nr:hypothetical protein RBSH_01314 [Rhodopirellula baltica SH28]
MVVNQPEAEFLDRILLGRPWKPERSFHNDNRAARSAATYAH